VLIDAIIWLGVPSLLVFVLLKISENCDCLVAQVIIYSCLFIMRV